MVVVVKLERKKGMEKIAAETWPTKRRAVAFPYQPKSWRLDGAELLIRMRIVAAGGG